MRTRRHFVKCLSIPPLTGSSCAAWAKDTSFHWVNDIHSKLNRTRVAQIHRPDSIKKLRRIIRRASTRGQQISICGARHAMGGQQFGTGNQLIDISGLSRVLGLDTEKGILEVESGIQWPELIEQVLERQKDSPRPWTIAQKQTGADRLSVGGALAANIHSRGLTMQPIISDVESFEIMMSSGEIKQCSRSRNAGLFKLAIGGYGLFGVITSIKLRLVRRRQLERRVRISSVDTLIDRFGQSIADGAIYGDFQFSIDPMSGHFLHTGILSIYHPVDTPAPIPSNRKQLNAEKWNQLLLLAHTDKSKAFRLYSQFYLETDGQLYWSDEHQMNSYSDDYHLQIDRLMNCDCAGSEMITEIFVPRHRLAEFMSRAAADFRKHEVDVIYGTIRLIEKDDEDYLAWAKQNYACIIFNLHVNHTQSGIKQSSAAFRRLIDQAIRLGGSYYLTYHKWASKEQLVASYPKFESFMEMKRLYDPKELFQSDWYRHHKRLLQT